MLKHLKFKHKIMIMPLLAMSALFLLFFVSQFFIQRNNKLLTRIKSSFVPALELGWDLEKTLTELQRDMQDAVNAADEEELAIADTSYEIFLQLFKTGETNPFFEQESLHDLNTEFQEYYDLARKTSSQLIQGESLDEQLVQNLQVMNEKYNAITKKLKSMAEQAKEDVSTSFAATLWNQRRSALIMNAIIFCFAILLGSVSILLGRSITNPLNEVIRVANQFTEGNSGMRIRVKNSDEIGTLGAAFNKMMEKIEKQDWLKTGQAILNERMRGEQNIAALSRHIISDLSGHVKAQIGALYLYEDQDQNLQLAGSYAYTQRKGNRNVFKLGEGLVGQAALEKQHIIFTDIPDDYIKINSGLGEVTPHNILVMPFLYENTLKGVIELGSADRFTQSQMDFLDQVAESVAIALHSAQSRVKMQKLLDETQHQSEALQMQQEELKRTNEELEEQTRSLRISEEKLQAQQEELRQTNEELEEQTRILERQKKELGEKNSELEKARMLVEEKAKDLELSNKYKSEFLANMSHELRTPLNSLLILSRVLYENAGENLTDKQIEYARTIHSSGAELLGLINDILDLSKVESGKMILNVEKMRMKSLATYLEQNFNHLAKEKGLFFKVVCEEDLPESIHTDRQRVEQIIKNLLSNAMKFTEHGGINVNIRRPAAEIDFSQKNLYSQNTVAVVISDTGIGIPEERQRLIFEAFQQVDGSISRKYGGTGLGLSITREFVKLLRGEIHLESQEGKGSTFTLYLPAALNESPSETTQQSEEAPPSEEAPHIDQHAENPEPHIVTVAQSGVNAIRDDRHEPSSVDDKFLLIIEDDPEFAKVLFDLAREKGFRGLIAGDGAAGLQLADQYRPSSIILDVGLPDITGWEVMEKLKTNPNTQHIPVHFITGQDAASDAMKMGAIGYLMKPVNREDLDNAFHKIEQALSQPIKKLLVVEDNDMKQQEIYDLLIGTHILITTVTSEDEAYHRLKTETFDCIMFDLEFANGSSDKLLERMKQDVNLSGLPILVYAERALTKEEERLFTEYSESIVVKGTKSPKRLLDEIELFLHRVEADLPESQQKKVQMLHDKELVLDGKRLLMADDDVRNIFALSSVLEEKGMTVLVASNGKEALDLLEQESAIDLVLMDIMMPEMDGYEAMKQIRTQETFKDLPIIALTAKAMKGDRQKCIDAGANDYLSKPIDVDKLLSLLRVWLY